MSNGRTYGLGTAQREVGHGGGFQGVRTYTACAYGTGLTVSFATHAIDGDPSGMAESALRILQVIADGGAPSKKGRRLVWPLLVTLGRVGFRPARQQGSRRHHGSRQPLRGGERTRLHRPRSRTHRGRHRLRQLGPNRPPGTRQGGQGRRNRLRRRPPHEARGRHRRGKTTLRRVSGRTPSTQFWNARAPRYSGPTQRRPVSGFQQRTAHPPAEHSRTDAPVVLRTATDGPLHSPSRRSARSGPRRSASAPAARPGRVLPPC